MLYDQVGYCFYETMQQQYDMSDRLTYYFILIIPINISVTNIRVLYTKQSRSENSTNITAVHMAILQ